MAFIKFDLIFHVGEKYHFKIKNSAFSNKISIPGIFELAMSHGKLCELTDVLMRISDSDNAFLAGFSRQATSFFFFVHICLFTKNVARIVEQWISSSKWSNAEVRNN